MLTMLSELIILPYFLVVFLVAWDDICRPVELGVAVESGETLRKFYTRILWQDMARNWELDHKRAT